MKHSSCELSADSCFHARMAVFRTRMAEEHLCGARDRTIIWRAEKAGLHKDIERMTVELSAAFTAAKAASDVSESMLLFRKGLPKALSEKCFCVTHDLISHGAGRSTEESQECH